MKYLCLIINLNFQNLCIINTNEESVTCTDMPHFLGLSHIAICCGCGCMCACAAPLCVCVHVFVCVCVCFFPNLLYDVCVICVYICRCMHVCLNCICVHMCVQEFVCIWIYPNVMRTGLLIKRSQVHGHWVLLMFPWSKNFAHIASVYYLLKLLHILH